MNDKLTHLREDGSAHMVDISNKSATVRIATASSTIVAKSSTITAILNGDLPKGDVLGTARIAGIMAAKKTSDLIPLCHPLPITNVTIEFTTLSETEIDVRASVKTTHTTGVEMEALTAVTIAALTLYDMAKAVDKGIIISTTKLLTKDGGKSGSYRAE